MSPPPQRAILLGDADRATAAVRAALGLKRAETGGDPGPDVAGDAPLVYLAAGRGSHPLRPDLADARAAAEAAVRRRARRVIVVASTAAIPPSHRHPGVVDEERPQPHAVRNPISAHWLALEALFSERLGDRLLILRAPPSGLLREDGGWLARAGRWVAVLPGRDPTIQVLDPDDLGRAVVAALASEATGVLHLAPRSPAPLRATLRVAGLRPLPVPALLRRLAPGVGRAELDFERHQWTVAGERAERVLGISPGRTTLAAAAVAAGRQAPAEERIEWFGLDRRWIERRAWLFGFLYRRYWRIAAEGIESVPAAGPAVLVGTHRGFMPWDAVMALWGIVSRGGRAPRFLVHAGLLLPPFIASFITRLGGVLACRQNAERLLADGELLGVFPEGVHGAFSLFRERYRVRRFRNLEFLRAARRHGAPVVPFVTVGSAEAMPIAARLDWRWWRRVSAWPCLPVALPWPLPTRWRTRYLPPRQPPEDGSERAVREAARSLRGDLQETMDALRRSDGGLSG